MGVLDRIRGDKVDRVLALHSKSGSGYDSQAPPSLDPCFGLNASIKTLYEGPRSVPGTYVWVNKPPRQLSTSAAREYDGVAIRVFKVKDKAKPCIGGIWPLKYYSIEVQNPTLVEELKPILRNKMGSRLDTEYKLTFSEPFQELWFCQEEIANLATTAKNATLLKPYLQLLLNIMDEMFGELRFTYKKFQQTGLVDFKSAWTLFPPGCAIYSYGLNSEMLCKVESVSYKTIKQVETLVATAKILAFNGSEFVWQTISMGIPYFKDGKPISEMQYYPLKFHPQKDTLFQRLISRGKRALDLQSLEYCQYDGIALESEGGDCDIKKHNVAGRILIDVVGYHKYHSTKGLREYKDPSIERAKAVRRNAMAVGDDLTLAVHNFTDTQEATPAEPPTGPKRRRLTDAEILENKNFMLEKPEDLAYLSGLIGGYALKNKLWMNFYIEDIEPMVWNDKAYEHLVYDAQQKDLVLSFVESHGRNAAFDSSSSSSGTSITASPPVVDDVIVGKGQGLIVLLSGPPGTGKTLTAEAVADHTHRPLFHLQAEDLGISAVSLGENLKRVFEMATDWNAVILLDEADVFMSSRNPGDIVRNELVSIFLRELEYFQGIIFLTTNLYETIDTAFRSRVSLHLLFPALSKEAREKVWRRFLDRIPEAERVKSLPESEAAADESVAVPDKFIDDKDIRELSLWELNGREIFNAVRMARSWCNHKGYIITLERMESGIKVTNPQAGKSGSDDYGDLYE